MDDDASNNPAIQAYRSFVAGGGDDLDESDRLLVAAYLAVAAAGSSKITIEEEIDLLEFLRSAKPALIGRLGIDPTELDAEMFGLQRRINELKRLIN